MEASIGITAATTRGEFIEQDQFTMEEKHHSSQEVAFYSGFSKLLGCILLRMPSNLAKTAFL